MKRKPGMTVSDVVDLFNALTFLDEVTTVSDGQRKMLFLSVRDTTPGTRFTLWSGLKRYEFTIPTGMLYFMRHALKRGTKTTTECSGS